MVRDEIVLKGLKENNLKNIDLNIKKQKITVFTGISGSGKSSVAFETLARESRRQMTMNYPLYVRNQMPRYERPHADLMQNLSTVVVVKQRSIGGNSRSSLGTYMDIDPLIRLLFSRIGIPAVGSATDFSRQSLFGRCPTCDGFGQVVVPDVNKLVDFDKSLREYAVQFKPLSPSGWQGQWMMTCGLFDPDKPIKDYPKETQDLFLYGPKGGGTVYAPFHTKDGPQNAQWDGLLPRFNRLYIHRDLSKLKQVSNEDVLAVSTHSICPTCHGSGLNPQVLVSKINGLNILEFKHLEITELQEELKRIDHPLGQSIAIQAMGPLNQLIKMGLGYLSLSRKMATLSGGEAQRVKINESPRVAQDFFTLKDANHNNLKNISLSIPKNLLVSVCGVSGSGKSSLMFEGFLEKYPDTIAVSQDSIGLSTRSTLATYMGIMDDIRAAFSKETGEPAGLFSFNSLGACPVCHGKGYTMPDVAFADPITITCEACAGTRYSDQARSYYVHDKNIVDILELTIDEALTYFNSPKIVHKLNTLKEVGLDYLTLGQTTSSFSGGEVQRLKLASYLKNQGQIYLLDEPSLGLHHKDNAKLLQVFENLVNKGNSVIIIEHNLDFIACSDWIIELGPGGKRGGSVIFEGTPKDLLKAETATAKWLKESALNTTF